MSLLHHASCVAIDGRAVLIEGPPGSGKSSLALMLIERGAQLIGDDGIRLESGDGRLQASPPPNIEGLLEVRNLGIISFPVAPPTPVALVVRFDPEAPRFIDQSEPVAIAGCTVPLVRLWPDGPTLALKAELALEHYGLK